MELKRAGAIVGIILAIALLCVIAQALDNWFQGIGTIVGDLDLGKGRRITIFSHPYWEVNRPLIFNLRDGSRVINDGCLVEGDLPGDPHNYAVVYEENQTVIGVLDFELSSPLFIMCDFALSKCWPCDDVDRLALFERLKTDNPSLEIPQYWK